MKNIFSCISLRSELLTTLLISTSLFCTLSVQAESQDPFEVTRGHSSSHRSKEKECRECDFVITAKDIACGTVVITKPGYYCLCEDAVFNPSPNQIGSPYIGAITISASNVTLDLRGRTLSQISKAVPFADGIIVNPGFTNIIIKNGTVRDFSDAGIRAGTVSTTTSLVTELSISDIRSFNNGLPDTLVNPGFSTGDGIGGAVILNAQDVTITNSDFKENSLNGIWAFNVTKYTMENCHCDDNTSGTFVFLNDQTAYGAVVTGVCADILISKCTFNKNTSNAFVSGFNLGYAAEISSPTNVVFDSCQFNDNTSIVSDPIFAMAAGANGGTSALGIEMNDSTNVTFINCEAHGCSLTINTPLTPTLPPANVSPTLVQGFNVNFCTNVTFTNCSSSGLRFQNNALPAVGVRQFTESFSIIGCDQVTLTNCHAQGNTNGYNAANAPTEANPSLFVVEGFDISSSRNIVLEDCTSSGHNQAAATLEALEGGLSITAGFNAHFYVFSFSKCRHCGPVVFRRCIASGNTDTGTLGGQAFGFCTREPQFAGTATGPDSGPYIFDSCIAENNTNNIITGSLVDTRTGTGFDILNLVNSKIINCFAEGNNIGINVLDYNVPADTSLFGSANNLFRGNVVSANTNFGIQDTTAAKSNAYYSNQAKNNGPTPATTNYSGAGVFPVPSCSTTTLCCVPANLTPVLYWTLPNAPCTLNTNCVVSTPLDNLSIVN